MNRDLNRRALAKKGFTLLELIVVITIIGMLGTLVIPKDLQYREDHLCDLRELA